MGVCINTRTVPLVPVDEYFTSVRSVGIVHLRAKGHGVCLLFVCPSFIEFGQCMLPFSPQPFVFTSTVKKYKSKSIETIILPVALWCETCSPTVRNIDQMFEDRVLRRIFGPKRDEVLLGWSKLHNVELYILYSLPSVIRMVK